MPSIKFIDNELSAQSGMGLCLRYLHCSTAVNHLTSMPAFEVVETGNLFCCLHKQVLFLAFQIEIIVRSDLVLVTGNCYSESMLSSVKQSNRSSTLHTPASTVIDSFAVRPNLNDLEIATTSGFRYFCGGKSRGVVCDCPRGLYLLCTQFPVSKVVTWEKLPLTQDWKSYIRIWKEASHVYSFQ